jgi:NTP pyrophosphatase (non-canonical NTP hydrolase)
MNKTKNLIEKYLQARNWHNNQPADLAKSISIEAAELLEIFQWGNISASEIYKDKVKFTNLKEEVADLFIYLFGMSVSVGFDPEKAVLDKLKKLNKKYPASIVKNNQKQYYLRKAKYRAKSK